MFFFLCARCRRSDFSTPVRLKLFASILIRLAEPVTEKILLYGAKVRLKISKHQTNINILLNEGRWERRGAYQEKSLTFAPHRLSYS